MAPTAIVGLGGGAALDVAKAIALMAHHPGDLFDYEDDKPGARPIDQEIPYWVALPTTAGTGSEVGRSAVVSDDETHIKKIIFSPRLLAKAVFADPELTLDLPAEGHRRHRHGRAHPLRRVVPRQGLPPDLRRHRARRPAPRRRSALAERAWQSPTGPRGARRTC